MERGILTPKNESMFDINAKALEMFPGEMIEVLSADTCPSDQTALYPTEFLNSLQPSGMPPHSLKLKIGCPVMLLRNLNIKSGMCNGTRLVVCKIGTKVNQQHFLSMSSPIGE